MKLKNYVLGKWVEGEGAGTPLYHAVTGEQIAEATTAGIDFKAALEYARNVGSPNLRKMTFHQRARMLKALALYLNEKKDIFYQLSYATGATKADSWVDIEGGIGNLFVYSSKGRRELPDHRPGQRKGRHQQGRRGQLATADLWRVRAAGELHLCRCQGGGRRCHRRQFEAHVQRHGLL